MPSLMLLDGERKVALGIARHLGRLGIPIAVGGGRRYAKACYSRYVSHRFIYPAIEKKLPQAHQAIIEQVRAWRPDVLMPVSYPGWSCIYAHYDEYAALTTIVPHPERAHFERLADKDYLVQCAAACGVPMPQTFRPQSRPAALAIADRLPYPVLLKPRVGGYGLGIQRAENSAQFEALLQRRPDLPIVQEYIDGEDVELTILAFHGEPLAGHAYTSLRNHPTPYGQPVACRSTCDQDVMQTGIDFLAKLRYHGIAHMDLRRDRRDGRPLLLDFQVPLPSTHEMSLCCGVDFPLLLYKLALGERPDPCFCEQTGVEFRWLAGELRHLARAPRKLRAVRDLLRWRNVATDFSLFDPLPHAMDIVHELAAHWRTICESHCLSQPVSSVVRLVGHILEKF